MGRLYLVPTPIGNLKDITIRALEILESVDVVLAEDTRKTAFLLKHYSIKTRVWSHHKFNEHNNVNEVARLISEGMNMALVTDAGSPGISDPGYLLVKTCINSGLDIESLPGATAIVPALVESGLPCDRFCFEGFLPHKKGKTKKITSLSEETRTMVFFESPYRLVATIKMMADILGEGRGGAVSREISKLHAETVRGSLRYLITHFSDIPPKGEIVLVVAGKTKESNNDCGKELLRESM